MKKRFVQSDRPIPIPRGVVVDWYGQSTDVPSGYGLCDGKWYDPTDMTAGQVGQASSDASHTVQTPNLINRFTVGAGSTYALGATGGATTHTLQATEIPSHRHTVDYDGGAGAANFVGEIYQTSRTKATNYTGYTGGGGAHNNLPPYYGLYKIMKL